MKVSNKIKVLSLITLGILIGCSQELTNVNSGSAPVNTVSPKTGKFSLSGTVQFPDSGFATKAVASDITASSTVSLIYPGDYSDEALRNVTIASGLTNSSGYFLLSPGSSFEPIPGSVYILEATKRIGGSGNDSLSLRTNVKWSGSAFDSITNPGIFINSRTTALSIMAGANTIYPDQTIGKMPTDVGVTNVVGINSTITADAINYVVSLVESSLAANRDPVDSVTYSNGQFSLKQLANGSFAKLKGCFGDTNCPTPAPMMAAIPTVVPSIQAAQAPTGTLATVDGCVNGGVNCKTGEQQVNTYTNADQQYPGIAVNSSGNYVITWTSANEDGSAFGIYAERFRSDGLAVGNEFKVNNYTSLSQFDPAVAIDNAGNFVVAWQSDGQDGSGYGIYAQRFDSNGQKSGTEFKVNDYITGDQSEPKAAMDSTGNFVITWTSNTQLGNAAEIYAKRYNAAGTAQIPTGCGTTMVHCNSSTGEFLVNTTTVNQQEYPAIAMNANGTFVISWHSAYINYWDVLVQRYNSSGVPQGGETLVNNTTTGNQVFPSAAIDSTGNFVITWASDSSQDGSGDGIYARRYTSNGAAAGNEFLVNTTTANDQYQPSIAMDQNDNFVITWESFNQDGNGWGVYAQRYISSGNTLGAEFRINTAITSDQYIPTIGMDPFGNFIVTWQSNLQDLSGWGIFSQRFNLDGTAK